MLLQFLLKKKIFLHIFVSKRKVNIFYLFDSVRFFLSCDVKLAYVAYFRCMDNSSKSVSSSRA